MATKKRTALQEPQAGPQIVEGHLAVPSGARFAILASRFNHFIVDHLVDGAIDAIRRHGGSLGNVTIVRVPGCWEMPTASAAICRRQMELEGSFAVIAVGAVIRGATPHFDYVAGEVTKGLAAVALETGIVNTFGILTTDTIEQAVERAGTKAGNKGWDAATSAIEMLSLERALEQATF